MTNIFYHVTNIVSYLNTEQSLDWEKYRQMNDSLRQCNANIRFGPAIECMDPKVGVGFSPLAGQFIGIYMRIGDKKRARSASPSELELNTVLLELERKAAQKNKITQSHEQTHPKLEDLL